MVEYIYIIENVYQTKFSFSLLAVNKIQKLNYFNFVVGSVNFIVVHYLTRKFKKKFIVI